MPGRVCESVTRSHVTEAFGASVVAGPADPGGAESPRLSRDYRREVAEGRARACHAFGSSARSRSAGAVVNPVVSSSAPPLCWSSTLPCRGTLGGVRMAWGLVPARVVVSGSGGSVILPGVAWSGVRSLFHPSRRGPFATCFIDSSGPEWDITAPPHHSIQIQCTHAPTA